MNPHIFTQALIQGLVVGIGILGFGIAFRILDFPDLTIEGSFPLGACVFTHLILKGFPPSLATFLAALSSAFSGGFTALIYRKLKLSKLLSGIITLTILYSVNLLVLGTSNRGILQAPNIFRYAESLETKFGVSDYKPFISLQIFGILFLIALLLFLFFKTIYGLKLRALGDNTELAEESGIKITFYYIFGLSLTNFLAGISGVITAQIQGFTDIHMGQGLLIVALAALILGEAIIPVGCSDVARVILSSVIGSILYYFLALTVITLGINATYIKFLTAVLVLFAAASGKKLVPKEEPHTHEY